MTNSMTPRATPEGELSPQNPEGAITGTAGPPEVEDKTERQEAQVPELRILEMIKTIQPGNQDQTMEHFLKAQEKQETSSSTPSPQSDSGHEGAKEISLPSGNATGDIQEHPETEKANMPVSLGANPRKPRKRAYQKLEEEAEEILKGWTPTGNSGVGARGTPEKPSQRRDDVKALKNPKFRVKPGPSSKTLRAPAKPNLPPAAADTWETLPESQVEVDSAPRRKIRRTEYEDVDGSAEDDAAATKGNPATTGKRRGHQSKRSNRLSVHHDAKPGMTDSKGPRRVSQPKAPASEPSRRGRPRGRTIAAGRRGTLGTKRVTNMEAPRKETESVKKQNKACSSTSVRTGRIAKPASRGGRGRGRPRKEC